MYLFVIGIVLIIGTYFIGIPFLQIIYDIDLSKQLLPLMVVIIGSVLYGLTSIISNSLIVLRKTFLQAIIFGTVSIISLIISELLVKEYKLVGASLSYFISISVLFILYIILYYIVIKRCGNNE
jgi:O-antigen/teichoic acid export membrane protein